MAQINIPRGQQVAIVKAAAAKYHIPARILWGVYGTETSFGRNVSNSGAGANGGAKGPFQFEDATARADHVNVNNFKSSAFGAALELSKYRSRGVAGMLSAYNAGPAGGIQSSYVRSVLQNARSLPAGGGGQSMGGTPGSSQTITTTNTTPGVDRSGDRKALIASMLLQNGPLSVGRLENTVSGLQQMPDTPAVTTRSSKTINTPGGGGGGASTGGVIGHNTLGRVDMGVDFTGKGGVPAVGDAVVTHVAPQNSGTGWPGQGDGGRGNRGALITYKILSGPGRGRFVYVAENVDPSVRVGQRVRAGQVIAKARGQFPFLETGWAADAHGHTLASRTSGYSEGQQTPAGKSFKRFLGL